MSRTAPSLARPARWLFAGVLLVALSAAVACGGGGSGDSISESEAKEATNRYLATTLGLFTGSTEPDAFIELFAPECRDRADAESLALVMLFIQGFAPELQGFDIEEADVGDLNIEENGQGVLVSPKDPSAFRVKIDGEFIPASEFFESAGFEATDEDDFGEPLLLVRRDGGIYIGDCTELDDLSTGLDTSVGFGGRQIVEA